MSKRAVSVWGLSLVLAVASVAGVFSQLPSTTAAPARTVRMTIPLDLLNFASLYVARYHGWFSEKGINLDIISTGGGGPDVAAVIAGSADFAFTADLLLATLFERAAGTEHTLLGVISAVDKVAFAFVIRPAVLDKLGLTASAPLEQKVAALKGLRIGVSRPGAFSDSIAKFYIRKGGYQHGVDVQTVAVGAADTALAALERGVIDIHGDGPPVIEEAITRGLGVLYFNLAKEDPVFQNFAMQTLVVRPDFAKKNSQLVRDMVSVLLQANRWIRSRPTSEVVRVIQVYFPRMDPQTLRLAVENVKPLHSLTGCYTEKNWNNMVNVFVAAGTLKAPVPMSAVTTNEYLPGQCK